MISSEVDTSKFQTKKGDCFLLLAVVAVAVLLLLLFRSSSAPTGSVVTVTVDGNVFGSWPVATELTVEIPGVSGINILHIADGTASVVHADCPDLICVRHKPIAYTGERIVCLPNKVVISISGPTDATSADAVSQ